MEKTIYSYKALNMDFTCKDFQYEIGKEYIHSDEVMVCQKGFHACQNPWGIQTYYSIINTRFAFVEQSGEMDFSYLNTESKVASSKIKILKELTLKEYIKACYDYNISVNAPAISKTYANLSYNESSAFIAVKGDASNISLSGFDNRIAISGDSPTIGTSGKACNILSSGDYPVIAASGNFSSILTNGKNASLSTSGKNSDIMANGKFSSLAASGDLTNFVSDGQYSKLAASGNSASFVSKGKNSVIVSSGKFATAKGINGTWIALAEYDKNNCCIGFATGKIGENGLVEDTWYIAKNGQLTPVE